MQGLLSVVFERILELDQLTVELLLELRNPLTTKVMTSVTGLGSATAAVVLLGLFHLAGWRTEFANSAVALAIAGVVVGTLMLTIQRPFPPQPVCMTDGAETVAHSFPSGHAAAVTIFALTARRSEALPFGIAAVLDATIAISRVYLGTHFLGDTIIGVLIGIGAFALAATAIKRYREREGTAV
jgi:undecaprenyl-diphosphatase